MPNKGFKVITVPTELFNELKAEADGHDRSLAKQIAHYLKTCDKEA